MRLARLAMAIAMTLSISSPAHGASTVRSLVDRPDDIKGWQVHIVYVQTEGNGDAEWDTNGTISSWVLEAQNWLQSQIGHQLIFDTFQGQIDVTYMKSKYSQDQLCHTTCETLKLLSEELRKQDSNTTGAKTYFYAIDGALDPNSCGWASLASNVGLIHMRAATCLSPSSRQYYGISWPAASMVHELLHTFGVQHFCTSRTDLMVGSPECGPEITGVTRTLTIDLERKNYVGGDAAGVDLLKLPIWKDGTGSPEYAAVTGEKTYGTTYAGLYLARVGETSNSFSWSFTKNISSPIQDGVCTLKSSSKSLFGAFDNGKCTFDVPATWRPGQQFTASLNLVIGPFMGSAQANGVLAREDFSSSPCAEHVCYVGGEVDVESLCWSQGVDTLVVQRIVNGKWVDIYNLATVEKQGCSGTMSRGVTARLSFTQQEVQYLRWRFPGNRSLSQFNSTPFAIIVDAGPDAPESSASAIAVENARAIELGAAADRAALQRPTTSKKITCIKGKVVKSVSGPTCPAGFKKKAA